MDKANQDGMNVRFVDHDGKSHWTKRVLTPMIQTRRARRATSV
jgi:hypothetical protein